MTSPSFKRAKQLQAEAAEVGFDWADPKEMLAKLEEELAELRSALNGGAAENEVEEELGDILFVLVNLARRLNLSIDQALNSTSDKFERRFSYILTCLARKGLQPQQVGLQELESLWQEAKRLERRKP